MKRERTDDDVGEVANKLQRVDSDSAAAAANGSEPTPKSSSKVRKGTECPYLDTIARQVQASMTASIWWKLKGARWCFDILCMQNLDFDFEKCCVVSLSPINVYACLVCGKYFQVN